VYGGGLQHAALRTGSARCCYGSEVFTAALHFKTPDGSGQTLALEEELRVGRGPHNDLVLRTSDVSWTHAVFRRVDSTVVVEDLGSRNGTFLDGRRLEHPEAVLESSSVRIGDLEFRVKLSGDVDSGGLVVLEDVELGVQYPIRGPGFIIGSGENAMLRTASGDEVRLTMLGSELMLGEEPIALPFDGVLGGRQIRITRESADWSPTQWRTTDLDPRILKVSLDPPVATVHDQSTGLEHSVRAEHRVSLLYFLAGALVEDRAAGLPPERCGWRSDAAVSVGVWGRAGLESSRSRLNTLNHRLRAELSKSGLPVDLVEKDAGWARLHPMRVEIDNG